jgi:hypothetical protein
LRTARGAGRADFFDDEDLLLEEVRRDWLPDDRDRELPEPLLDPEVRDAGGEDVRVAMSRRLRDRHTSHTHPTPGLIFGLWPVGSSR